MDVDVKAMIDKVVDKAKNDPKFMEELKKDPEKAIESVIGVDIPDGVADKVLAAVKSADTLDKVSGVLDMFKK
ncbi:MAG: hypothetical protein K6E60_07680 [Saccharofermentans sp.]|nr:hypothetical protein [Saccharofermentans sp.]